MSASIEKVHAFIKRWDRARLRDAGLALAVLGLALHTLELLPMTRGREAYLLSSYTLWHRGLLWCSRLAWLFSALFLGRAWWLFRQSAETSQGPLGFSVGNVLRVWLVRLGLLGFVVHLAHVALRSAQWITTRYDLLHDDLAHPLIALTHVVILTSMLGAAYGLAQGWRTHARADWPPAKGQGFERLFVAVCGVLWLLYLNVLTHHATGQSLF